MTRRETLERAIECVCGKREQDYGTPEDNFKTIAEYWTIWLKHLLKPGRCIEASDVAMMMGLLKVGRISTGSATDDSFIDLAGYTACAAEIIGKSRDKEAIEPAVSVSMEVTEEGASRPSVNDLYEIYKTDSDLAVKLHAD